MIDKILTAIIGAIRKVWSLLACILLVAIITAVVLFGITVFASEQVLQAIEIVKGLIG